ncbi:acetolactate synthase, regulatory subunit, partial [Tieghemiomyces parasiticus]
MLAHRALHPGRTLWSRTLQLALQPSPTALQRTLSTTPRLSRSNAYSRVPRPFARPPQHSVEEAVKHIILSNPETAASLDDQEEQTRPYILNVLVQNEPGALTRISGIMSARNYNIDTLVVSKTEVPSLSRMTITIRASPFLMQQAKQQLEDLIPVWAVVDYSDAKIVQREMLL